jgi:hypothetical protein
MSIWKMRVDRVEIPLSQGKVLYKTFFSEFLSEKRALEERDARRREFLYSHPVADDAIATDCVADGANDFFGEAKTVLPIATVFIRAPVAEW